MWKIQIRRNRLNGHFFASYGIKTSKMTIMLSNMSENVAQDYKIG